MNKNEKLIVALDVKSEKKALNLVEKLKGDVKIFKVGSELFTSSGGKIIKKIRGKGCEVFLDLKFHDIPNTVASAAIAATNLKVFMFNLHALGGTAMMKKTMKAVKKESKKLKIKRPKVIAVTILTSIDQNALKKVGISGNIKNQVLKLAKLAKDAGLDGVVASSREAKIIRKNLGGHFLIVTPGIRPAWASLDDQKRIATPKEAIANGADFIVVGRPIIEAKYPTIAAQKILEEIR